MSRIPSILPNGLIRDLNYPHLEPELIWLETPENSNVTTFIGKFNVNSKRVERISLVSNRLLNLLKYKLGINYSLSGGISHDLINQRNRLKFELLRDLGWLLGWDVYNQSIETVKEKMSRITNWGFEKAYEEYYREKFKH